MNIQASEISKILKEQIKNFGEDTEVAEVGKVLSVLLRSLRSQMLECS